MRTRTLTNLIADVRKRADIENVAGRFPDSELTEYINSSITRLYTLLDRMDNTYYVSTSSFSSVSGQQAYNLPADFGRLKKVSVYISSSKPITIFKYMPMESDWLDREGVWGPGYPIFYRLQGNTIRFAPIPTGVYTLSIDYSQTPARLVSGSDTFDGDVGFEEFVILDAAIRTRRKNNKDASDLIQDKAEIGNWIETIGSTRDVAGPERIQDVQSQDIWPYIA